MDCDQLLLIYVSLYGLPIPVCCLSTVERVNKDTHWSFKRRDNKIWITREETEENVGNGGNMKNETLCNEHSLAASEDENQKTWFCTKKKDKLWC